ncbi:uncharacterized protein LOC107401520 isoform X1 [Peromyscus maniculatus bairdii]|uniref:uncharacterized protein LOC107401520 isoform X1 n=1 Tax=Peromyscus maniculatus bairdii TaxID=230844 RepID=UPI003FD4DCAE
MKTSAFQRGEVNPPRRKQIKVSAESRLHPCSAQGRRGLQHGRVRGSAHGSPQDWGPTEARRTGDPRKPAGLGTHGSPQDTGSASHLESSSVKPTRRLLATPGFPLTQTSAECGSSSLSRSGIPKSKFGLAASSPLRPRPADRPRPHSRVRGCLCFGDVARVAPRFGGRGRPRERQRRAGSE